MQKRGQITFFLIIILLLASFIGVMLISSDKFKQQFITQEMPVSSNYQENIQGYLNFCIETKTKESLNIYGTAPDTKDKHEAYINNSVSECFNEFLEENNIQIDMGEHNTEVLMGANSIEVTMNYPIILVQGDKKVEVERFYYSQKLYSELALPNGEADRDYMLTSPDGKAFMTITSGTIVELGGDPVDLLSLEVIEKKFDGLSNGVVVGENVYRASPAGVVFSSPIKIRIDYSRSDLPLGAKEQRLSLAYFDPEKGMWVSLQSEVDATAGSVTAETNHFTVFAIVYDCGNDIEEYDFQKLFTGWMYKEPLYPCMWKDTDDDSKPYCAPPEMTSQIKGRDYTTEINLMEPSLETGPHPLKIEKSKYLVPGAPSAGEESVCIDNKELAGGRGNFEFEISDNGDSCIQEDSDILLEFECDNECKDLKLIAEDGTQTSFDLNKKDSKKYNAPKESGEGEIEYSVYEAAIPYADVKTGLWKLSIDIENTKQACSGARGILQINGKAILDKCEEIGVDIGNGVFQIERNCVCYDSEQAMIFNYFKSEKMMPLEAYCYPDGMIYADAGDFPEDTGEEGVPVEGYGCDPDSALVQEIESDPRWVGVGVGTGEICENGKTYQLYMKCNPETNTWDTAEKVEVAWPCEANGEGTCDVFIDRHRQKGDYSTGQSKCQTDGNPHQVWEKCQGTDSGGQWVEYQNTQDCAGVPIGASPRLPVTSTPGEDVEPTEPGITGTGPLVYLNPSNQDDNHGLDGYVESEGCMDIAEKLKPKLESLGYRVFIDDSTDAEMSANDEKAAIYVSIYSGSSNEDTDSGTATFYDPDSQVASKSKELAQSVQNALVSRLKTYSRGVKKGEDLPAIKDATMPAILTEVAMHTSSDDIKHLNSDTGREKIAAALADGIDEYMKSQDKKPSTPKHFPETPLKGRYSYGTYPFGATVDYQGPCKKHTGIDIFKSKVREEGKLVNPKIFAVGDGKIVHIGYLYTNKKGEGRGSKAIIIDHGGGVYSTYSHNSYVPPEIMDEYNSNKFVDVKAGDWIARIGREGYVRGSGHLHFEILENVEWTGNWRIPWKPTMTCDWSKVGYKDPKQWINFA